MIEKLYQAIEAKLPPSLDYTVYYHYMREDEPGDCGIYLYESSNDKESIGGEDIYNCIKVQVQVNYGKSINDSFKAIDWLTNFVNNIETEPSTIEGVEFIAAQHQGPKALDIGQNQYGLGLVRSIIDLKYIFTE